MNKRYQTPPWALAGGLAALVGVIVLTRPAPADAMVEAYRNKPAVKFDEVGAIVSLRCSTCHAERPSNGMFNAPPAGIRLDTPEEIRENRDRLFVRAVATRTMPLANMTGMTEEERAALGAWYAHGAEVPYGATMPSLSAPIVNSEEGDGGNEPTPALAIAGATPEARAQNYFKTICAGCHGAGGRGDGTASLALNPKPRNFGDPSWQSSVTDAHIRDTIVKGGAGVGKSPLMPPQTVLAQDPQTLDALVKIVRAFGKSKVATEVK